MAALRIGRYPRRVRNLHLDRDVVRSRLKHLVADLFRLDILEPDKLSDEEPLMGGSLCLDSLDVLELALGVEEEFGIALHGGGEWTRTLPGIVNLADHICACSQSVTGRRRGQARIVPGAGMRAVASIAFDRGVLPTPV